MRPLLAAGIGLIALATGRQFRDWGATKRECLTRLPGDDLVAEPADITTRAVTIDAPADAVWRWLVQIGQDRGGVYSYDRLVRPGWFGMRDGLALPVARIDEGRSLVLRQRPPDSPWDEVWSFQVVPQGPSECRLVSRSRSARGGPLARLAALVMDPVTLLMTRRMLLGIKRRAESGAKSPSRSATTRAC
jgi:hypothetical protein